jgi:26S proteasome regulatory subunit N2
MGHPSSSAAGIIAYLNESDANLKKRALEKLNMVVDLHWAEVCDSLPMIEELSEDVSFSAAPLAASVASKCFYHLQEYNDALRLALSAGDWFDVSRSNDEYTETMLSKCIDEYTEVCRQRAEENSEAEIDPRMEAIIEQMFQRCYRDGCFEQAIGIALDTRRIDKLDEVCQKAITAGREAILEYTFQLCQGARNVPNRVFRLQVIAVLVKFYGTLPAPDYRNVCFGLQYLNRPNDVALRLNELLRGSDELALQAYQIAFDMQEAENQGFVLAVISAFPGLLPAAPPTAAAEDGTAAAAGEDSAADAAPPPAPTEMEAEESVDPVYTERLASLRRILCDSLDIDITLNFLFLQSKTDLSILNDIKTATENRSMVLHNATVAAHAYMNAGTTQDTFLRENLTWLRKATNWSKFTAVSSIGVVHRGHVHESMKLLQPYLPQGGVSGSAFAESGALYALGLIHANKGGAGDSATIAYLTNALRNSGTNEVVQHGACLGVGLASMATGNPALVELMKESVLYADNAIAGEAAALSIGLVMLGQSESTLAQEQIPQLLKYAHDTQHEKIIRAIAIAIAMMVYGKEEGAEVLIEQMARDRDPIIRYGAMYATAMAYCGTADNNAVRRLLHVAVSDVSDDVRRAAVSSLGFVMFKSFESLPKLVSLLAESFNPHVRFGACIAVGVACAGTAFKDAIDLLLPMLEDQQDFVRQGACMSLAMVLMQASEARSPSVKKLHEHLVKVINDKHQAVITKQGAILASGILQAGGRNVVISMQSRAGFTRMGGVVGLMMWLQHWYWHPMMHMISLSFAPTMVMGLNKDFDVPKDFSLHCKAPPSMFAYPKAEEKDKTKKELVTTAVLSTTARANAREARREARKAGGDLGSLGSPPKAVEDFGPIPLERVGSYISTMSVADDNKEKEEEPAKKEKEPSFFNTSNPDRIIPAQSRFLTVQTESRYTPVSYNTNAAPPTGIVMLVNKDPEAPEDVVIVGRIALGEQEEAEMPAPFEWDPSID